MGKNINSQVTDLNKTDQYRCKMMLNLISKQ